ELAVSGPGRPSCAREAAFKRSSGPLRLALWIDVQHDPRHLAPVGAFGIEHAHIGDGMLFVIHGQLWAQRARDRRPWDWRAAAWAAFGGLSALIIRGLCVTPVTPQLLHRSAGNERFGRTI